MTYEEQLASVQTAIEKIQSGAQAYSISSPTGSRSFSKADLKTLYEREKWLRCQIARGPNGGIPVRGATPI